MARIRFRHCALVAATTLATTLAGCAERTEAACPPPATSVERKDKPALVIATPADTPAARRAVDAASRHPGPVILARNAEWPAPPAVVLAADLAGTGSNPTYTKASAARARRCFKADAGEALERMGTAGRADELGHLATLVGMGLDVGNGKVTVVEVGLARHLASGVDLATADLTTPVLRQRLVREHVNAGVLRPVPAGVKVVFLSPGEGAVNSVEAGFLTSLASLLCEVIAPDPSSACTATEAVTLS